MSSKFISLSTEKVTVQHSWIICLGIIMLFNIPYGVVGHLPLLRETISFILGEQSIPFLPWTFIIYISAFIQAMLVIRYIPAPLLRKIASVLSCALILGMLLFILIPIRYPRELYISNSVLIETFYKLDSSGNCFPSLHVVATTVFAFCYSLVSKSSIRRSLMWLWTVLIIISVLTTKQHYLIDVFGGLALAMAVIFVLKKMTNLPIPAPERYMESV